MRVGESGLLLCLKILTHIMNCALPNSNIAVKLQKLLCVYVYVCVFK